jgi:N-acetylglucosamine kinase-like BadF-type ATPase
VIDVVLTGWNGGRSEIAALSRQVSEAAALGDDTAAGILSDAGRELAALVDVTRRRLGFGPAESVPVSYSGGTFAAPGVLTSFTRELAAREGRYELRQPLYEPVVGAALYAAKLTGTPLGSTALGRLASAETAEAVQGGNHARR